MFKLMSMNLNYEVDRHGPWERRMQIVRGAIEEHAPDVVALQAVRAGAGGNQAAQLSECLPDYPYVHFEPAQHLPDGQVNGSAWLARVPPAQTDARALSLRPGLDDTNARMLLHARFDLAGSSLQLFNAHFSWNGQQAEDNVRETLEYLAAFPGPAVLVGDLNNAPENAPLDAFRANGWTDAWGALRPGEPGLTFESGAPSMRIDYAWVNPLARPALRAMRIVADRPDAGGARGSDHFGLLAEFDFAG